MTVSEIPRGGTQRPDSGMPPRNTRDVAYVGTEGANVRTVPGLKDVASYMQGRLAHISHPGGQPHFTGYVRVRVTVDSSGRCDWPEVVEGPGGLKSTSTGLAMKAATLKSAITAAVREVVALGVPAGQTYEVVLHFGDKAPAPLGEPPRPAQTVAHAAPAAVPMYPEAVAPPVEGARPPVVGLDPKSLQIMPVSPRISPAAARAIPYELPKLPDGLTWNKVPDRVPRGAAVPLVVHLTHGNIGSESRLALSASVATALGKIADGKESGSFFVLVHVGRGGFPTHTAVTQHPDRPLESTRAAELMREAQRVIASTTFAGVREGDVARFEIMFGSNNIQVGAQNWGSPDIVLK